MRHRQLSSLVLAASLLAALPAAADVYTIRLSNGGIFESRYQPKQAAWDTTLVTFVDETGTEIALPQALIADVTSQSEVKGYGTRPQHHHHRPRLHAQRPRPEPAGDAAAARC